MGCLPVRLPGPGLQWEHTREGRVGTWRDFMTKKSKKSKGGSLALGGLKPPRNLQTGTPAASRGSRSLLVLGCQFAGSGATLALTARARWLGG